MTCDFEGALDVYKLPASGIVPPEWTAENLANAFDTSRSYQERVLLLNTLKYRNKEAAKDLGLKTKSDCWKTICCLTIPPRPGFTCRS